MCYYYNIFLCSPLLLKISNIYVVSMKTSMNKISVYIPLAFFRLSSMYLFFLRYFEMMEKVASNGHSPARSLSDEEEQKSRDESERKRIEQKMKQKAENTECDPENIIEETSDSHNELMFQSRPSHRVPSDVISSILGKAVFYLLFLLLLFLILFLVCIWFFCNLFIAFYF